MIYYPEILWQLDLGRSGQVLRFLQTHWWILCALSFLSLFSLPWIHQKFKSERRVVVRLVILLVSLFLLGEFFNCFNQLFVFGKGFLPSFRIVLGDGLLRRVSPYAIAFLLVLFAALPRRLGWRLEGGITRNLRSNRSSYLSVGLILLVIGIASSYMKLQWWPQSSYFRLDTLMYVVGTVLTAGGFLLAIFALFEIIDRPGDIEEILRKATNMIEDTLNDPDNRDGNRFLLLAAEYPLIGALSVRETHPYKQFKRVLLRRIVQKDLYLKVVIPQNWATELEGYKDEFQLDNEILEEANKDNSVFIKKLDEASLQSGATVRIHRVESYPRYQAVILGWRDNGILTPQQGIVFFAIRSEIKHNQKNGTTEGQENERDGVPPRAPIMASDRGKTKENQKERKSGSANERKKQRPVYILAWKTRDTAVLNDIIRLARQEVGEEWDEGAPPASPSSQGQYPSALSNPEKTGVGPSIFALVLTLVPFLVALVSRGGKQRDSSRDD
jgi:hypothetical protein